MVLDPAIEQLLIITQNNEREKRKMIYLPPCFFDETIAKEILEKFNININDSEYHDTCCSVESINRPKPENPFFVIYQGTIGLYRKGFILCWLNYTYTFDGATDEDDCTITIKEVFPENLQLFDMDVKSLTHE